MRISSFFLVIAAPLIVPMVALAQTPATTTTPAPSRPSNAPINRVAPSAAQQPASPGQVWVNANSKVYHCSGDKYYGKTKHGSFMNEADAKAKGFHADHGKACG